MPWKGEARPPCNAATAKEEWLKTQAWLEKKELREEYDKVMSIEIPKEADNNEDIYTELKELGLSVAKGSTTCPVTRSSPEGSTSSGVSSGSDVQAVIDHTVTSVGGHRHQKADQDPNNSDTGLSSLHSSGDEAGNSDFGTLV